MAERNSKAPVLCHSVVWPVLLAFEVQDCLRFDLACWLMLLQAAFCVDL